MKRLIVCEGDEVPRDKFLTKTRPFRVLIIFALLAGGALALYAQDAGCPMDACLEMGRLR